MEVTGNERKRGLSYASLSLSGIFIMVFVEAANVFHWNVHDPYFIVIYNSFMALLLIPLFLSLNLLKEQKLRIDDYGIEYYIGNKLKFSERWENIKEIGITPASYGNIYGFNWDISMYVKSKKGSKVAFWASAFFKNKNEFKDMMNEIVYKAMDLGGIEIWDPFNLAGTEDLMIKYAKMKNLKVNDRKINRAYKSIPYLFRFRNLLVSLPITTIVLFLSIYGALILPYLSSLIWAFTIILFIFLIVIAYSLIFLKNHYIFKIIIFNTYLEIHSEKKINEKIDIEFKSISDVLLTVKKDVGDISIKTSDGKYFIGSFHPDVAREIRNRWLNWKGKEIS